METQMLLREPDVYPSEKVLKKALGNTVYNIFESFIDTITSEKFYLTLDWRYYNDSKAWLCKVVNKKKTVVWLSIWNGFFKTSFYFTQKHLEAIAGLDISKTIKEDFALEKHVGRLIPMIMEISKQEHLKDLLTVIDFKKSLK